MRNILDISIEELSETMLYLGEKRHRARQVLSWVYKKNAKSFSQMTDLPLTLRDTLSERFTIEIPRPVASIRSEKDSSQKFLLQFPDGTSVETVLMEFEEHRTICISSQAGCPLGCTFCSTGCSGYERNLTSGEILSQALFFKANYLPPRTRFNIVFMGMGEPLLNIHQLTRSLEILNAEWGFGLGEKRITLSTIGIPEKVLELAKSPLRFSLALSLNATTDSVRRDLMPAARNIRETLEAATRFARARKSRVTIEYVLIEGVNDHDDDARRLADLTAGKPFKINLIPLNEWIGCSFKRPSEERIENFLRILLPTAPAVTVRRSQGTDIEAACGQLRLRKREPN